jgi:acyl carrier protein
METENHNRGGSPMIDRIRTLLAQNSMIPIDFEAMSDTANLYDAGLTSFASVQMMLAIEE